MFLLVFIYMCFHTKLAAMHVFINKPENRRESVDSEDVTQLHVLTDRPIVVERSRYVPPPLFSYRRPPQRKPSLPAYNSRNVMRQADENPPEYSELFPMTS